MNIIERGWNYCDWEAFTKDQRGHGELIRQLKKLVKSKYHLKIVEFNKKEAQIAQRHGLKTHYYTPHEPDLIISDGEDPEDRIFIEYVNTTGKNLQNFLRDLKGMLALSTIIKSYRGFVVVTRDSIYKKFWSTTLQKNIPVEIMSLKSFFFALDQNKSIPYRLDYLIGKEK